MPVSILKIIGKKLSKNIYYTTIILVALFVGYDSINGYTFFLDTPTIALIAEKGKVWQTASDALATGRYMPIYWFVNWLGWHLVGGSIIGIQIIQVIILILTLLVIGKILSVYSVNQIPILIIASLIIINSATAEVIMTVSKAELSATFFSIYSLMLILTDPVFVGKSKNCCGDQCRIILFVISTVFSIWAKETSIVLLISSLLLIGFAIIEPKNGKYICIKRTALYIITTIACIIIARLPIFALEFTNSSAKSYAKFSPNYITIKDNVLYYALNCSDLLWLLCCTGIIIFINYIFLFSTNFNETRVKQLIGSTILWVTSISYFIGMLFWRWGFGYYMYPVYLLCGTSFILSLTCLYTKNNISRVASLIIAALFLIFEIQNTIKFVCDVKAQKIIEKHYSDAINKLQQLSYNKKANIFLINFSRISEPPIQTGIMMKTLGNTNVSVFGGLEMFDPNTNSKNQELFSGIYFAPPKITPKHGDLLVQFEHDFPIEHEIRAISNPRKIEFQNFNLFQPELRSKLLIKHQEYITVPFRIEWPLTVHFRKLKSGYKIDEFD